jgi:hypothetical protein
VTVCSLDVVMGSLAWAQKSAMMVILSIMMTARTLVCSRGVVMGSYIQIVKSVMMETPSTEMAALRLA